MPRYFFHIREHNAFDEDLEGIDLPSIDHAHTEALNAAREIVAELVAQREQINGMTFEVCDESGSLVHRLPFRLVID